MLLQPAKLGRDQMLGVANLGMSAEPSASLRLRIRFILHWPRPPPGMGGYKRKFRVKQISPCWRCLLVLRFQYFELTKRENVKLMH